MRSKQSQTNLKNKRTKMKKTKFQNTQQVKNILTHAAGPFTIHFWAPMSKWLLSATNVLDFDRPVANISISQQIALCTTGLIWSRYAMVIIPKNWNLMLVNLTLASTGSYHLARKLFAELDEKKQSV